jgi:uroporphyrinogen-III synthase
VAIKKVTKKTTTSPKSSSAKSKSKLTKSKTKSAKPLPTNGLKNIVVKNGAKKSIKKILITQPKPQEGDRSPYFEIAKKHKLEVDFQPFFDIHGITTKEFRRYRIHLHEFTAIIFTSRNSIDHFFRLLGELKTQISSETKYFCTTESIGLYLQKFIQYRKRKVFFGDGSIKDLLSIMDKHVEENYLVPGSESPNVEIINHLKKNNFKYVETVLYRTVPSPIKHLVLENYDMLVFFSPSAIDALKKNFPRFKQQEILFGAFGSNTCLAVKDAKYKLHIEAPKTGVPSMSAAIEHFLKN